MTPMAMPDTLDFRIALGLLSLALTAGLVVLGALVGIAVRDRMALRRTGRNGVLEIIATGAFRRHAMFFWLTAGILGLGAYRAVFGTPAAAGIRVLVMLMTVGIVLAYAIFETMDRWKLRFYFRKETRREVLADEPGPANRSR